MSNGGVIIKWFSILWGYKNVVRWLRHFCCG